MVVRSIGLQGEIIDIIITDSKQNMSQRVTKKVYLVEGEKMAITSCFGVKNLNWSLQLDIKLTGHKDETLQN